MTTSEIMKAKKMAELTRLINKVGTMKASEICKCDPAYISRIKNMDQSISLQKIMDMIEVLK